MYPCYVSHGAKSQLQMFLWESWPSRCPCLYIHDKNPFAKAFPAGNGWFLVGEEKGQDHSVYFQKWGVLIGPSFGPLSYTHP